MQSSWRVGSLLGIPFFIDSSWLWVLILVTAVYAKNFSRTLGLSSGIAQGFLMALLLFASVLLHELGHSLVARSQGIKVNSITLFMFGGVASIERESKTPLGAFLVAIAGPAVSVGLFFLFGFGHQLLAQRSSLAEIATELSIINLFLALFNLIPGLPLDGGQIFKALVWQITGSRLQGTRWAAKSGLCVGWLAVFLGGLSLVSGNLFNGIWTFLIGGFILRNATAYEQLTSLQEALLQLVAADAMTRDFKVLDAGMTLRQFADEFILANTGNSDGAYTNYPYYAASDGRYRGMVAIEDLNSIERSQWETATLQTIARSLGEIAAVQEKTPLVSVINDLENNQLKCITVLSPVGAVAGTIDRGDIVRTVAAKLNLTIPDADIRRIKAEGVYPPSLQLPAIVKSINL